MSTAPSILETQSAADWLRDLLRENLVGACVIINNQHLHVDLKRIGESVLEAHGTLDEKLAAWVSSE